MLLNLSQTSTKLNKFISVFTALLIMVTSIIFVPPIPKAVAAENTVTWTKKGDFENNDATTGTATTRTDVSIIGTGDNTSVTLTGLQNLTGFQNFPVLAAGGYHSLGIKSDGTLWAWGDNGTGQLGDGTTTDKHSPVQIGSYTWKQIDGGMFHSLGIKSDGTLWAWGNNTYGQLGDGTTTRRTSPVQIGNDTWKQITGNRYHSLGIKSDGTLWAWGDNFYGELGDGTTTQRTSPVQIGSDTWKQVAAGYQHSLGIKSDGTLWAWGRNIVGELGDGTTTQRTSPVKIGDDAWQQVEGGLRHSLGIKSDGTLWAWGYNNNGQLGDGTTTYKHSPVQIGSDTWKQVAAGYQHSLGIKSDGTLWAWGDNYYGELGDGTTTQRTSPVQIGTSTWNQTAGGYYDSLGVKLDGKLWAWGSNYYGQLGDGTTTDRHSPVQIGSDTWKLWSSYLSQGTISGLKIDAGVGREANWSTIFWNSWALPSDTAIKFNVRTSNDNSTWSAWSSDFSQTTDTSTSGSGDLTGITSSRWLEIKLTLESTDGADTPTLNDFTVQYEPTNDTTSPIITLNGDNPQIVELGDPYIEAGASATDNSGDLTGSIVIDSSSVDTNTLGFYIVTYSVTDASGNSATQTRTVNVVDTTSPIITLNGDNPQIVELGDPYIEAGASATDNSGDLTGSIVIDSSSVDTNTLGFYIVTYSVTDASGNSATQTRTVNVVDTTVNTPGEIIIIVEDDLIKVIEEFLNNGQITNPGIGNSFLQKVKNVQAAIINGDYDEAVDILNALINSLEAQSGKKIDSESAQILIQTIQVIINLINNLS